MPNAAQALDLEVPGLDELFVAGEWTRSKGSETVAVVSPSTEEILATVPEPSLADCDAAVAAAREAYDSGPWPHMPVSERVEICRRFCEALEARLDDFNRAWAYEAGAPVSFGQVMNGDLAQMIWRNALEVASDLQLEERRTSPAGDVLISRVPRGPVLAILTYNGPVIMFATKVIPALLAGCPVVVKPAPESQLTTRIVAECAREAGFPRGVLSVLAAEVRSSQHLVDHPDIDMVALTGGTAIGADVLRRLADRIGKATMELGGKSAAILLEDCDLDAALPTLAPGSVAYTGQICMNLTRIVVPRSRYDEVVAALAAAYEALPIGDPLDPETAVGPLAVKRALDRTEAAVSAALDEGAGIITGGRRPPTMDRGWYYELTLLRDVERGMGVARDEIFGPVVCAIPYDGIDDAVEIANDSRYGLAGSVYSADPEAALAVARRMQTGNVAINRTGVAPTEPWGGVKQSGYGRLSGREGLLEFTDTRQFLLEES
jgi:aldehyde dehydrogenase (NAD+)